MRIGASVHEYAGIAILGRPTYPPQLLANLVGHLAALPAGLPPELVEQPLFAKQCVVVPRTCIRISCRPHIVSRMRPG
eukprot:SAG11_NODE_203_length_12529_cov_6.036444_6_plen_78_part_00